MNVSSKTMFTKNDLLYTDYINVVEAIIRHQKLRQHAENRVAFALYVKVTENY